MADTKNTQTAPAGLPAKEWFTLDEVAARWGTDKETILHYGLVNHLTLCVYVKNAKIARFEQRPYFLNLFIEGEEPEEAGREWEKVEEWRTLFSPLPIYQYVVAEIQNGQRITLTTFPSDDMNFSFSDADDDSSKEPVYMVREGVEVGLEDVVIVRREVERFEKMHNLIVGEQDMPSEVRNVDWKKRAIDIEATLSPSLKQAVRAQLIAKQLEQDGVKGRGGCVIKASTVEKALREK